MDIRSAVAHHVKQARSLGILSTSVLLSACQPTPDVQSNLTFNPPNTIMQVRAIDRSQLSPVVSLSNGTSIPMISTGDNSWSGTINVQPNTSYFVSIEWIETLPEGNLVLAQWSQDVTVNEDGAEIFLSDENYDYSLDLDGDQISNLQERENDTNPFVHNDQINDNSDGATTGEPENGGSTDGDTGGAVDDDLDLGVLDGGSFDVDNLDAEVTGGATDDDFEATSGGTAGSTSGETDGSSTTSDDTNGSTSGETGGSSTAAGDTSGETAGSSTTMGETDGGATDDSGTTSGDTDGSTSGTTDGDGTTAGAETTHTKASVLVPRIASNRAPDIDGEGVMLNAQDNLVGEWQDAVQFDDSGAGLWIKNLMIDKDADSEDGAQLRRWAAMHDGTNLYLLVLSDDVGARHADSTDFWHDDSLELFIDGDNSKLTDWTSGDDFQQIIPLLKQNSTEANNEVNGRYTPGPGSTEAALDVEFFTGPGIGPDGIRVNKWEQDVYELAIPLSSVGIVVGVSFGFELQLNDDDNGVSRDSKWGWFHPSRIDNVDTDQTYLNPSVMGVIILEE